MKINLPSAVCFLLGRLHEKGFEAYVVGGCVRDSIMGIVPHDWDICTSATPDQMIEVFSDCKVIPTGLQHGTISVVINNVPYEITTYRIDGEYEDNRHPKNVEFVSDLKLDLMRRDFTINAMAYNEQDGLIDLFGGVDDINKHEIKCVGNPDDRFQEDALRILRAIRFAIRYNFKIELNTKISLHRYRWLLKNISAERISSELTKMLSKTKIMHQDIELLEALSYCLDAVDERIFFLFYDNLFYTVPDLLLRLAIICDNPEIKDILEKLRFPNEVIEQAVEIRKFGIKVAEDIEQFSSYDNISTFYYPRKLLSQMRKARAWLAVEFAKSQLTNQPDKIDALKELSSKLHLCFLNKDTYMLSALAVDGNDLVRLGYKGRDIGIILNKMLDLVMRDEVENDREKLIEAIGLPK